MNVNPEKPFISRNFKLHDEGKVYDVQNSTDRLAIIEAFIKRNFLRDVIENGDLDQPRQDEQAHLCVKMLDYCKSEELNRVLVNTSIGRLLMRHGQHRGFANLLARASESVQTRNLMKGAASLIASGDPAVAEVLFNRILSKQSPETRKTLLLNESFGEALKRQQKLGNLPPAIVEECVAGLLSSYADNNSYLCVNLGNASADCNPCRRPNQLRARRAEREANKRKKIEVYTLTNLMVGRRLTTPEA